MGHGVVSGSRSPGESTETFGVVLDLRGHLHSHWLPAPLPGPCSVLWLPATFHLLNGAYFRSARAPGHI